MDSGPRPLWVVFSLVRDAIRCSVSDVLASLTSKYDLDPHNPTCRASSLGMSMSKSLLFLVHVMPISHS